LQRLENWNKLKPNTLDSHLFYIMSKNEAVSWKESWKNPNTPIKGTTLPEISQTVKNAINRFKKKPESTSPELKVINSEEILAQNVDSLLMKRLSILATPVVGDITVEEALNYLDPIESSEFFNLKAILQNEVDLKSVPQDLQNNFNNLTQNQKMEFSAVGIYNEYQSRSIAATWFLKSLLTEDHGRNIMSAMATQFSENSQNEQNINSQNPYWQVLALPTKDGKMVVDKLVEGLSQELSNITTGYHGIYYPRYLRKHPFIEENIEIESKIDTAKKVLESKL